MICVFGSTPVVSHRARMQKTPSREYASVAGILLYIFFESKHFIYSVRNVHSRETEQHYLNIVM